MPSQIDFVKAWCEYSGEKPPSVLLKMSKAAQLLAGEWQAYFKRREMTPDSIADFYRKSGKLIYDLLARAEAAQKETWPEVCAEWLNRYKCKRVLDFGCGLGHMGLGLAQAGFEVMLCDIPHLPLAFVAQDLGHITAGNICRPEDMGAVGEFDAIVCLEVFEHLPEPDKTAAMLAKKLRPGGILFSSWSFGPDAGNPLHLASEWNNDSFQTYLEKELGFVWLNPGPCWARVLQKRK